MVVSDVVAHCNRERRRTYRPRRAQRVAGCPQKRREHPTEMPQRFWMLPISASHWTGMTHCRSDTKKAASMSCAAVRTAYLLQIN